MATSTKPKAPAKPPAKPPAKVNAAGQSLAARAGERAPLGKATMTSAQAKGTIQQYALTHARPLPTPKAAKPAQPARSNPGENAAAAVGRGLGALLRTGLVKGR